MLCALSIETKCEESHPSEQKPKSTVKHIHAHTCLVFGFDMNMKKNFFLWKMSLSFEVDFTIYQLMHKEDDLV